jgi:uncharacterized protein (TIGR03118 family)
MKTRKAVWPLVVAKSASIALCLVCFCMSAVAESYEQTNLVSDIFGIARVTDLNLKNSWGIAFSGSSPIWIADNGTGFSTIYRGDGQPVQINGQQFMVAIPSPGAAGCASPPSSAPTGVVFNGSTNFVVSGAVASGPAIFIFDTEDGTISGWNPQANFGCAVLKVDHSDSAVYKGLAIGTSDKGAFIYASNFRAGVVEMYDSNFRPAGTFTDSALVSLGFAPFGIQNVKNRIFVTFAKQDDAKHDDVAGPGNGYVDEFDTNGNFIRRFASQGPLNSPWGIALAGRDFGHFTGRLLIGNFGDGTINAFSLATGRFIGTVRDVLDNPIVIGGLWGLKFGMGGANNGPTNTLFFTAGINHEGDGLFGMITVIHGEGEHEHEHEH